MPIFTGNCCKFLRHYCCSLPLQKVEWQLSVTSLFFLLCTWADFWSCSPRRDVLLCSCAGVHEKSVVQYEPALSACGCAHVWRYDGGGGRARIKQTRSTSQPLGGPCSHGHTCKPSSPKIGQWNKHSLTHTPESTQRIIEWPQSFCAAMSPAQTSPHRKGTSSGLEQPDYDHPHPSTFRTPLCMAPHIYSTKTCALRSGSLVRQTPAQITPAVVSVSSPKSSRKHTENSLQNLFTCVAWIIKS